eukprot:CAMPEP_0170112760 /NCGR_PEP_ID=MMETSP0020_2-20130122/9381_1 /TAXON_ID=98059 /ORGANISM="Dinobryon sp., Strain UTEXLB2267" /LENGTH=48 /DNA_ID= /DNA_START= /DNA_END= /DNA_ORIENTATION=
MGILVGSAIGISVGDCVEGNSVGKVDGNTLTMGVGEENGLPVGIVVGT